MQVHHYSESKGIYLGSSQAMADPMEPGRWLIPAWSTTLEPGEEIEGMEQVFNGTEWVYRDLPQPEEGSSA
jgi:hypothetical protein